jgi:hypothetical protein
MRQSDSPLNLRCRPSPSLGRSLQKRDQWKDLPRWSVAHGWNFCRLGAECAAAANSLLHLLYVGVADRYHKKREQQA